MKIHNAWYYVKRRIFVLVRLISIDSNGVIFRRYFFLNEMSYTIFQNTINIQNSYIVRKNISTIWTNFIKSFDKTS